MAQPVVVTSYSRPVHLILLVLAVVCFVIYTLFGFGEITGAHAGGWIGLGLVFFSASFLL